MKIVSGGQTGADRAALDFAIAHGIEYGGWIPKGRRAEDGPIPLRYSKLRETITSAYPERTRKNVEDSDATLIISHGELSGGSLLTKRIAFAAECPCLHLDLLANDFETASRILKSWIERNTVNVINVAGPRASADPEIYEATCHLLTLVFD
ncbi:MAG: putative molybdenum carrier protein [Acidobacteriota bacterium]|nr:putative molybdenum carrier protein [Acidobacteriota bacterium]MDH3528117.1 putative molybdenum carrier protein [Acidobacteriota bacterium]